MPVDDVLMPHERAALARWNGEGAAERRAAVADLRTRIADALAAGDDAGIEAVALESLPATLTESLGGLDPEDAAADVQDGLERILGTSDLVPVRFFELAQRAAHAVCRIEVGGRFAGTGFMVGRRLMLTNNHVLWSVSRARRGKAIFDYQRDIDGEDREVVSFDLEPQDLFVTNVDLDYSLVRVADRRSKGRHVTDFGTMRVSPEPVAAAQPVNVIQHPRGRRKEVAFRNNLVVDVLDPFVHYLTDTEKGSSGSPVFNDAWQLVALHHAGVPKDDDADPVEWVANEGVKIRAILADIRAQRTQESVAGDPLQSLGEAIPPNLGAASAASTAPGEVLLDEGGVRVSVKVSVR